MSSFLTMKELMECKPEEVPPKLRRIYEKEKEKQMKEKSFMDIRSINQNVWDNFLEVKSPIKIYARLNRVGYCGGSCPD